MIRGDDTLDVTQAVDVPSAGVDLTIPLWSRKPNVVPLRPSYPGATVVDARWLRDGDVAVVLGVSQGTVNAAAREIWRLDRESGRLERATLPAAAGATSAIALSPNGGQVAFVTTNGKSGSVLQGVTSDSYSASANTLVQSVTLAQAVDGAQPIDIFDLPGGSGLPGSERITDLVWTPDCLHLVVMTRMGASPARSGIYLVDVASVTNPPTAQLQTVQLALLPAEVVPASTTVDPTSHWLAGMAHAGSASGGHDVVSLFAIELRPDGMLRDIADLGSPDRVPAAAPVAWAPATQDRSAMPIVFVAPVPSAPNNNPGLFDLFSSLRGASPSLGLFRADLSPSNLQQGQPARIGAASNLVAPLWRPDGTVLAFGRQGDALALRTVNVTTGAVNVLDAQLPTQAGQGSGVAGRWDQERGRLLLLAHASTSLGTSSTSNPVQAWLVSFMAQQTGT
jgi:hypothetical protein